MHWCDLINDIKMCIMANRKETENKELAFVLPIY